MLSDTNDPAKFWLEYEKEYGEKVLAHALGCYLSGWDEYSGPLWGLLIATEGGFRFHHFPQENWLSLFGRLSGDRGTSAKEQTMYIRKDQLLSASLYRETNWFIRLIIGRPPRLILVYRGEDGSERKLMAETDKSASAVADALSSLLA